MHYEYLNQCYRPFAHIISNKPVCYLAANFPPPLILEFLFGIYDLRYDW